MDAKIAGRRLQDADMPAHQISHVSFGVAPDFLRLGQVRCGRYDGGGLGHSSSSSRATFFSTAPKQVDSITIFFMHPRYRRYTPANLHIAKRIVCATVLDTLDRNNTQGRCDQSSPLLATSSRADSSLQDSFFTLARTLFFSSPVLILFRDDTSPRHHIHASP